MVKNQCARIRKAIDVVSKMIQPILNLILYRLIALQYQYTTDCLFSLNWVLIPRESPGCLQGVIAWAVPRESLPRAVPR